MHLIAPLAAGIRGAEGGTVTVRRRGTSTVATVYSTFESASGSAGSALSLDTNGARVLYVNQLVDVEVYSSAGVLIREFTDGVSAANVEYRGQSFTGTNYDSGASGAGTNYPTTAQAILDKWFNSAGAKDFKVLLSGVETNLEDALVPTNVFNVKATAYGAVGDSTTDDTAAIAAAIAAADAAGGGVVFFPYGGYRCTASLSVPGGVTLEGVNAKSSALIFDNATTRGILVTNADGEMTVIKDLGVAAITANIRNIEKASDGDLIIDRCYLYGDFMTHGVYVAGAGNVTVASSDMYVTPDGATSYGVLHAGTGSVVVNGCVITADQVSASIVNCVAASAAGHVLAVGNVIHCAGAFETYAFVSTGAVVSFVERGNLLRGTFTLSHNVSPKPTTRGEFGSRDGRVYTATDNAASITLETDLYDTFVITRTTNGNQSIEWESGRTLDGSRFTLVYYNNSGGASGTITWGSNLVTAAATFSIGTTATHDIYEFVVIGGVAYEVGAVDAS